jgi:hypothetical protein
MPLNSLDLDILTVDISEKVRLDLLSDIEEQGQIVVHCAIEDDLFGVYGRVWPTTYLIDSNSDQKSKLLQVYGISMAPVWTPVPFGGTLNFTLIFSSLPKSCKVFDLVEVIPEPGGLFIKNIVRNNSDVYHVVID